MLLKPFEASNEWVPPSVILMSRVTVGERGDLAWAECEPPLRVKSEAYPLVLLQSRRRSPSVWDLDRGPVEVYVCTTSKESETLDQIPRSDVRVLAWGILTEA